jgi:hypothetical protein
LLGEGVRCTRNETEDGGEEKKLEDNHALEGSSFPSFIDATPAANYVAMEQRAEIEQE